MGTRFSEGELDELLDQLDFEELDLINKYVDPNESRLPARERPTESRYDCDLDPTGPFDRASLIKFLEDKAKGDKDWDEYKPYVHETRGKVWKPPEERETTEAADDDEEIPLSMDIKTDYDDLLDGAEEDDLKDIGAILGLNFFPELTKATKFEPVADEPPNAVNVEEAIKQVKGNDAELKVLNLNNIRDIKRAVHGAFRRLGGELFLRGAASLQYGHRRSSRSGTGTGDGEEQNSSNFGRRIQFLIWRLHRSIYRLLHQKQRRQSTPSRQPTRVGVGFWSGDGDRQVDRGCPFSHSPGYSLRLSDGPRQGLGSPLRQRRRP